MDPLGQDDGPAQGPRAGHLSARIAELEIAAPAKAWRDAGFTLEDSRCRVGSVGLALDAKGEGIAGWTLAGVAEAELDGLPTKFETGGRDSGAPTRHLNAVIQIDHVVAFTPDLERTAAAFEAAGVRLRRVREADAEGGPIRQGFFRLGEVILEVVQHERVPEGPARFWGVTFTVSDPDAASAALSERLGPFKDAVQPGRRIATMRKEAGLGLPVALITPDPK